MKPWFAVGLMLEVRTSMVVAKDAPMVPDLQGADFGVYPSDVEKPFKAWAETMRKDPEAARYVHVSKRISIDHNVNCDNGAPLSPENPILCATQNPCTSNSGNHPQKWSSAMDAIHSKSVFVYGQVKRALRSGRYAPGQRIDPATLAAEFKTSPTPVRFALYRLVGETLVVDHARGGLHVPLLTEVAMRDLYDWMERLLLMACDIGAAPEAGKKDQRELASADDDPVKLTWQLFDAIARATTHSSLHHAVKQANDRLAPIRRAEQGLLKHSFEELSGLKRHWQARDTPALKCALRDYHERRKRLVPRIVALLSDGSDYLHQ